MSRGRQRFFSSLAFDLTCSLSLFQFFLSFSHFSFSLLSLSPLVISPPFFFSLSSRRRRPRFLLLPAPPPLHQLQL